MANPQDTGNNDSLKLKEMELLLKAKELELKEKELRLLREELNRKKAIDSKIDTFYNPITQGIKVISDTVDMVTSAATALGEKITSKNASIPCLENNLGNEKNSPETVITKNARQDAIGNQKPLPSTQENDSNDKRITPGGAPNLVAPEVPETNRAAPVSALSTYYLVDSIFSSLNHRLMQGKESLLTFDRATYDKLTEDEKKKLTQKYPELMRILWIV